MQKTKSIHNLEERMSGLAPDSIRYKVLDSAKGFKSSWIELGQYLFMVYKDKLFRDWGYLTFEAYCSKEIGVRQVTAVKLLKSYSFLEKEEPQFLKRESMEERKPHQIPSLESVNALRLAKSNERLPEKDYQTIREDVLEKAREDADVKKKIRYILKSKGPKPSSAEEKEERRTLVVKRLAQNLQSAKAEMTAFDAPQKLIKKIEELLELISDFSGISL